MKISFTTLSCPDWSWDKILKEAVRLGYDGIEVRGVEGEMFLPKAKPFLPENIDNTISVLKQKGLAICCLDTSSSFHDPERFDAAILEAEKTIDLAQSLGVPYIRVFGNNIPNPAKKEETIKRVAKGLETVGTYADRKGICVLIETHGDFSSSNNLLQVLNRVDNPAIGVLWDINHPYKVFGEPIEVTFERLGKYIKHTHIKDSKGKGKEATLCLIGEGDVPIAECIDILKRHGYSGWLSLEWEKKWHPELEEPELVIPAYIRYIKKMLSA
ncbi:sugar phosphate isomerase/epimerase family protein [Mahella australiensis]|uniref:Xylose isomerase domain-containing protein TIM barrel n=1 Tax=Mahella australiensis (strain DSM 15567 / CIP 107919 / 50-1 BON) TaxID=697281 RepID=F3ZZN6_MAHA5|nr:sugar phosphate isomerase/epimerase family protein [Mahella australiensis]AEE96862.1 Xylose isomerase domain-containing protein TIM barrel [Mahella australiensis 50-1 BON]